MNIDLLNLPEDVNLLRNIIHFQTVSYTDLESSRDILQQSYTDLEDSLTKLQEKKALEITVPAHTRKKSGQEASA